jgi:hypothetical protein
MQCNAMQCHAMPCRAHGMPCRLWPAPAVACGAMHHLRPADPAPSPCPRRRRHPEPPQRRRAACGRPQQQRRRRVRRPSRPLAAARRIARRPGGFWGLLAAGVAAACSQLPHAASCKPHAASSHVPAASAIRPTQGPVRTPSPTLLPPPSTSTTRRAARPWLHNAARHSAGRAGPACSTRRGRQAGTPPRSRRSSHISRGFSSTSSSSTQRSSPTSSRAPAAPITPQQQQAGRAQEAAPAGAGAPRPRRPALGWLPGARRRPTRARAPRPRRRRHASRRSTLGPGRGSRWRPSRVATTSVDCNRCRPPGCSRPRRWAPRPPHPQAAAAPRSQQRPPRRAGGRPRLPAWRQAATAPALARAQRRAGRT